jgi:hypothetical protein
MEPWSKKKPVKLLPTVRHDLLDEGRTVDIMACLATTTKELTGRWKKPNDERSVAIVQGIGSETSAPVLTTDSPRIFTMVLVSYW